MSIIKWTKCVQKVISHFRRSALLRKATVSFVLSVCPSVCTQNLGSNWTYCMIFDIILLKYEKKIESLLKSHKNNRHWTCRPDCTFVIIFSLILFRPRNISDRSCIGIETNFMPSKCYQQILAFRRWLRIVTVEADRPQMAI